MNKSEIAERDRRQERIYAWRRIKGLEKADGVYLRAEYGGREFIKHVPYPCAAGRPYGWHVSDAYYWLQKAFNTKHTDQIQWASQTAITGEFGYKVQYHVMSLCCGGGGMFDPRTQLYVNIF